MSVSFSELKKFKFGNGWAVIGDLTFDDSYPTNGESVENLISLANIYDIKPMSGTSGYIFEYVPSTEKIKVYTPVKVQAAHSHAVALDTGATGAEATHTHAIALDSGVSATEESHTHAAGAITGSTGAGDSHGHAFTGAAPKPLLVTEEVVTITTHTGTLAHVPLYIVAVQVTAGSTPGAFKVIPVGETPLTTQVAVDFTTGGLTFLDTDAVTAVKVTYIPKRASGNLSAVTVDEVVVASASKVNLAARAGIVQYIWNDTANALLVPEPPGEEPTAGSNCVLDINDSGDTSIDTHADINGVELKVTYVPYTQIPAACFIDDTDVTLNSEAWNFTADDTYIHLVVPGFGVNLVGESVGANEVAVWQGPSGSVGAGVATWNPLKNAINTGQTEAMLTTAISWLALDPLQLVMETPAGSNATESTHTHDQGSLAGAATGAGSAHSHGPGTLADTASGAGSSHTHDYGTLADAASGTGGAISAAAADELTNESSALDAMVVRVIAFGY